MNLVEGILKGEPAAIARGISYVENDPAEAARLMSELHRHVGKATRLGFTGPPGVGKSTLINEIAFRLQEKGEKVGIIAVDPTSPFTGGALLGDRVRMAKATEDGNIFMRSMATRGAMGGIARATADAADILDAAGKTWILVETVGVGQSEIEVSKHTDCVLVILSPESGDSIQAMKSGIMEIADVIVINKKDRPGADKLVYDIQSAFQLGLRKREVAIFQTQAYNGAGVPELMDGIRAYLETARAAGSFEQRRTTIAQNRLKAICEHLLHRSLWEQEGAPKKLESAAGEVVGHRKSFYEAAEELLRALKP